MAPFPFRLLCLLLAILGVWLASHSIYLKIADPTSSNGSNFYAYTFWRFEPLSLYTSTAFLLAYCLYRAPLGKGIEYARRLLDSRRLPLVVAFAVLLFTCLGRFYFHQNFDLCLDESLTEFEAKILQHHHLMAEVPPEWIAFENAMRVSYQNYHGTATHGYWASGFLPGFAFIDSFFDSLDLGWATSPVLATISIFLIAALARRAFPERASLAAGIAVLLLACSPQFLMMAMTKFAWTAHLCGTLFWVWLFTHPKRIFFLFTPIVGALLIGLHQPHVHCLIAAPFLLRLIYTFKWKESLWFGGWYLAGLYAWYHILILLRPTPTGTGGELANMGFPFLISMVVTSYHAMTLYAWTTPILIPLCYIGAKTWTKQPPLIQDSVLAALVTFLFYLGFPQMQGHGWGFRYMQSAYGLMALAATGGAIALTQKYESLLIVRAVVYSVVFSLVLQIPYRAYEVRTVVRPMSLMWDYLASRPCDFVIVRTRDVWYSWDLIRNDPWLQQKPFIFADERLTPDQKAELARRGSVIVVGADDVRRFGVTILGSARPQP